MTQELKFERKTCGRCGGSGQYSYCQMHGTTCFGCWGSGKVLTKRGQAAYAWFKARRVIKASEIQLGMFIGACGLKVVVQSLATQVAKYESVSGVGETAVRKSGHMLEIQGQKYACSVPTECEVELLPATKAEKLAELKAAIEYQGTLTEAGTVRERQKEVA